MPLKSGWRAIKKAITKEEMARHCRRTTRGTEVTTPERERERESPCCLLSHQPQMPSVPHS